VNFELGRFRRLAACAPGTRFRFERPAWTIRRTGVVVSHDFTPPPDPVPCVVVQLDTLPDREPQGPANWHPDTIVEVIE
jgi:hypothetical protein